MLSFKFQDHSFKIENFCWNECVQSHFWISRACHLWRPAKNATQSSDIYHCLLKHLLASLIVFFPTLAPEGINFS